jgi:putative aldouronate transport system substrate-binding protein
MHLWQYLQELTGIKIDFREADAGAYKDLRSLQWVDKKNWPDIFYTNNTIEEQTRYSALGALTPLNDDEGAYGNLLEKYAPNFSKMMEKYPQIEKNSVLDDGKIYSFTSINTVPRDLTYKVYVQKQWLEAEYGAGYYPETVEQFKQMLQSFQTIGEDVIPLIGAGGGLGYIKNYLLSAFGYTTHGIQVAPGTDEVVYAGITDNYKAFLKYANDLYNGSLLYKNSYAATQAEVKGFGNQGKLGVFQAAGAFVIVGENRDDAYTSLPPLTSTYSPLVNGERQKMHLLLNDMMPQFAILPSTTPYSREIVRLMDWFYTDEASMIATFGVEGKHWAYADDTRTEWDAIVPEGTTNLETFRATLSPTAGLGAHAIGYRSFETVRYEKGSLNRKINTETEKYVPYLTSFPYHLHFTPDEIAEKALIEAGINSHMTEYEMAFINGGKSIDNDWSAHINTLNSYGLPRLIEIYQAAYDRYLSI